MSRAGDVTTCVIQDRYTCWIWGYPSPDKSTESIVSSLRDFVSPHEAVDLLYFDNAEEYLAAARQLGYRYATRSKNRPASNGVAERAVRRVLEGARTALYESGLPHACWRRW